MSEYKGCEPSNCPDCGSDKTAFTKRWVNLESSTLHQWSACNDCGYQWLEVIAVDLVLVSKGDTDE